MILATWVGVPAPALAHRVLLSTGDDVSSCASREELSARVHAALRFPEHPEHELRIDIRHVRETYELTLVVFDEVGTQLTRRDLVSRAAGCRELDDTLVLVSALMLDAAVAERRATAAEHRSVRWSAGLVSGTRFLALPRAYIDGGLALSMRRPHVFTVVRLVVGSAVRTAAAEGQLQLRALTAEATLCGLALERRRFALGVCGSLTAGQLRGRTRGLLVENATIRTPHTRTGVGLTTVFEPASWFALSASVVVDAALTRTSFAVSQLDGPEVIYRVPRVGARLELAALIRIDRGP
ncbi:MAG: hypothetical protein R3B40_14310 [Polyangiales bacterium]|nr:hypothetical protein [Myxococcales bacterium]